MLESVGVVSTYDMQLQDHTGIACDYCGSTCQNDFTYYSFDFRCVSVIDNRRPPINVVLNSTIVLSLDICPLCYGKITTSVITNYKKVMSPKRGQSQRLVCDITGQLLSGTYDYYYCVIVKVDVQLSGQPNVCIKCKKKTIDNKRCECGSTEFVKPAIVKADHRHLELVVSEAGFNQFKDKYADIRKTISQWTTRT